MGKPVQTVVLKPSKTLPSILTVLYLIFVLYLLIGISNVNLWWLLGVVVVVSSLWFIFVIDSFTGYLKLSKDLLTRRTVFSTRKIKISEIKEASVARSIFGPSKIDFGNAKDGYITIVAGAFRKSELKPFLKQLHDRLEEHNPKRAQRLQKALLF